MTPPEDHQRNLLGRAVGGPPWLEAAEARALLVARLANLLSGHAGVGPELCRFLVDRVNDGFVPAVPGARGRLAGEVIPLAHAFQTLVGAGLVLGRAARSGTRAPPWPSGVCPPPAPAKEGIALLAGSPVASALALARLRAAERLAAQLQASAAAAIDALQPPSTPTTRRSAAWPATRCWRRSWPACAGPPGGRRPGRGCRRRCRSGWRPRCWPSCGGPWGGLDEDVRRALVAVTDSPAWPAGGWWPGGFHAVGLAAGMDAAAVALVQAAELAGQRLHRLLDGRFSGLPDQLSPDPGPVTGLVVVHKRAAGALHEARRLAAPASVGQADTSLGQEDAASFAPEAAEQLPGRGPDPRGGRLRAAGRPPGVVAAAHQGAVGQARRGRAGAARRLPPRTWSPPWTRTVRSAPTWPGWWRPWNATSCPCPRRRAGRGEAGMRGPGRRYAYCHACRCRDVP